MKIYIEGHKGPDMKTPTPLVTIDYPNDEFWLESEGRRNALRKVLRECFEGLMDVNVPISVRFEDEDQSHL